MNIRRSVSEREARRIVEVYGEYGRRVVIKSRHDPQNPGNRWIAQERAQAITSLLNRHGLLPLVGRRVLDVGCGRGAVLAFLVSLGAEPSNLFGIDLLPDRIEEARRANPEMAFASGNAEHLDFPDRHFDLALAFTIFSSILESRMAINVAEEIRRVLRPGGAVLWYDFRFDNPANPHTRGMTKKMIAQHFPSFDVDMQTLTLFPPLARRLGWATSLLYPRLAAIPLLRTHYLGLLVKSADSTVLPEQT